MLIEAPTFYKEQKALGTTLVEIDQVGVIFAKPGQRRAVATLGLGECTAVAIQFEKPNDPNIRGAIIAHYQPFVISRLNVENGIRVGSKEVLELGVVARAIIVSPGTEDPKSPTAYSPQSEELKRIQMLTVALKRIFGEDTSISNVGYRPPINRGWIRDLPEPKDRGTVLVEYSKETGLPKLTVDGVELSLPLA